MVYTTMGIIFVKILVGSKNPVKIRASKKAFSSYFSKVEVEGLSVLSRVPSQPKEREVFEGAENRLLALEKLNLARGLEAEYLVGIESGLFCPNGSWFVGGVVSIRNGRGETSFSMTSQFQLPNFFQKKALEGVELSQLVDRFSGKKNTKRKQGTVGFLSKGILQRKDIYVLAISSALLPFISREMYFETEES